MDLPPDKAKLLKSYDDDKKWELICDQVCIIIIICLVESRRHAIVVATDTQETQG